MDAAAELTLLEACWRTVVLGIVQGLTEFLPISSTAHLKVVPVLAGWGDPGVAVTAVIQLGSIAAVIGDFRRDCLQVCRGVARADFRWDEEEDALYMLEVNTQPGMTATSLTPEQGAFCGISGEELVNHLLEIAQCDD